ncbi:SH3 domain-containing protein [Exiguobacterium sp. MMG028]|uniref:SH3 domain-containing protein n=1 Tax=Exiguobacterium sp. MMG028 TaxID=3021979 RepID=UPI0022FDDD08|nr:SH3 domain-containing protein [Exiguobacterium sp. MMG028]MDA5561608.1 SH3 domain-containing protein [Exiguobacterium sp. MMG028]
MKSNFFKLSVVIIVTTSLFGGITPEKSYAFTGQQSTTASTTSTYTTTENLYMRSSYSRYSSTILLIPKGKEVQYLSSHGANNTWFRVKYEGKIGYVSSFYLTKAPSVLQTLNLTNTQITLNSVSLKSNFVSTAPTITTIKKNEAVKVLSSHGANNTWYKIDYNGKIGYVPVWNIGKSPLYAIKSSTLYSAAYSKSTPIKNLSPGDELTFINSHGSNGTWYEVRNDSLRGYIPKWDVSVDWKDVVSTSTLYANKVTNLYESTISTSKIITNIPQGAQVSYYSKHGANGTWYKIMYNGQVGYSAAWDYSNNPTSNYGPEITVKINVTESPYALNVRQEPNTSSSIMGSIPTNTIVKVKSLLNSSWGMIVEGEYAGKYIHLGYTVPTSADEIPQIIEYSTYPISISDMARIQYNNIAQTDAHRYKPAYIPRAYISVTGSNGIITKKEMVTLRTVNFEKEPKVTSTPVSKIPTSTIVEGVGRVKVGTTVWLKVRYNSSTGYIQAKDLIGTASALQTTNNDAFSYGKLHTGEIVKVTGQIGNFYSIEYRRPSGYNVQVYDQIWRRASLNEITSYIDPSKIDINSQSFYQFLNLSKSAGTTSTTLNKVLASKGTLHGQGQAFVDAGKQYNINEVYLLSHALHETGNGTSLLASGVPVDKDGNALINSKGERIYPERPVAKTVYNMYGIKATDSDPLGNGAKYAFEQKWFSPKEAIIGGAYWIGSSYINHPTYKQNTLYKMRYNPDSPGTHQYATNIAWADIQTRQIYDVYQSLDAYTLNFDVPKYQ